MKRIINTLTIAAVCILAFACQEHEALDLPVNESIVLRLFSGAVKALDTDAEAYVNHVDVFIFEEVSGNPANGDYYGRYEVKNVNKFTLNARRSSFPSDKRYSVYLVANSNLPTSTFEDIDDYADLVPIRQTDENLYISGLTLPGAPQYFLMDAAVKNVQLNNGVLSDNTDLSVTLERAAAKVYINIKASENIEFKPFNVADGSDGGVYYIRNLPVDAFLLAEAKPEEETVATVVQTPYSNNQYFTWKPETDNKNVTLTAYVYPHHWTDASLLEQETCVVMNLPLTYTKDGVETHHYNSWYKIPMTGEKFFRRNNYYEVNIDLNRPGATSETVPYDLTEVHYNVMDWAPQSVDVGGEDKPVYLMVNKTKLAMHNVATDASTLEFASSSPVTVTVKDAYYLDKFGQKKSVTDQVLGDINGVTEGGIAGNITVNSPVPENNAIRYFTLVVTNQDGIAREVAVTQYPLEYITNQQGWYSYREDFGGTNYQNQGNRRVAANWSSNSWSYYTSQSDNYFFGSKVATQYANGTSEIYRYWYSSRNGTYRLSQEVSSGIQSLNNARMYHVQITSTSDSYIVAIPKRDPVTDYTLSDADNSQLVSPSFMIASQLGATTSVSSTNSTYISRAQSHCSQYVETYFEDANGNMEWDSGEEVIHLDDWRLPTEKEIEIIVNFQTSSEVMDVVLAGANYFCASPDGYVRTGVASGNSIYTRCIRDVY